MGNYVANPNASSLSHSISSSDLKSIEDSRIVTRFESSQSNRNMPLSTIDDPNLHLAIQSLDALLNKVLHEKAQLKARQEEQQQQQLQAQEQQHKATLDSISSPAALASLAQMLNQAQIDQQQNTSLALSRRPSTAMMQAPLYRCPMDTNRNHQESATTNKVNYKNLFPRSADNQPPSSVDALFGNMFSSYQVEELNSTDNSGQRRNSQLINNFSQMEPSGTGAASSLDTIRINLPEILDQQDEITILRLLIKLLASKVNKLSDEKRRLLQNVSVLSDINAEMAAIIERGFHK